MSSLKEIKNRIASVRSTLKTTSAMKLVASAKLRKAQGAAESMRPYEEALNETLLQVCSKASDRTQSGPVGGTVAVVAFSSNSSLCGAFNSNVIRQTLSTVSELGVSGCKVALFPAGRKMVDALRKAGLPVEEDMSELVTQSSYAASASFAERLMESFRSGVYSKVILVYTHFITTSSQKVLVEDYLYEGAFDTAAGETVREFGGVILEPSREELLEVLLPKVYKLKLHSAVLESLASEHSARVIAMQTASDNAEDILQELTLEYNKGRQQKITAELLDIVGGSL